MELGKTGVQGFRIEITAIQLPVRLSTTFMVLNLQGQPSIDKLIIKDFFFLSRLLLLLDSTQETILTRIGQMTDACILFISTKLLTIAASALTSVHFHYI